MTDRKIAEWAGDAITALEQRQQEMIDRAHRGEPFEFALFDLYGQAKAGAILVGSAYETISLLQSTNGKQGGIWIR
jgi:hypothetical protein